MPALKGDGVVGPQHWLCDRLWEHLESWNKQARYGGGWRWERERGQVQVIKSKYRQLQVNEIMWCHLQLPALQAINLHCLGWEVAR